MYVCIYVVKGYTHQSSTCLCMLWKIFQAEVLVFQVLDLYAYFKTLCARPYCIIQGLLYNIIQGVVDSGRRGMGRTAAPRDPGGRGLLLAGQGKANSWASVVGKLPKVVVCVVGYIY